MKQNRKNIFYWALSDFANSVVIMTFVFHFSGWLAIEQGKPAWWFNGALAVSSILFLCTLPFLTKRIDQLTDKLPGLRLWTLLSATLFSSTAILTLTNMPLLYLTAITYSLSMYALLVSFLYFTPFLNELSSEKNRSLVSGIGQGASILGQISGLMISVPIVSGAVSFLGETGRAASLLPASLLFALLVLPMLFLYKSEQSNAVENQAEITSTDKSGLLSSILQNRPLLWFLLAYLLFSEAIMTFATNFSLYLDMLFKIPEAQGALLTSGVLCLSAIGAVWFGKLAGRYGDLAILKKLLLAWVVLLPIFAFVPNTKLLLIVLLVAGPLFGPVMSISRAIVSKLAHQNKIASSFSMFIIAERFASFVGPLIWGTTVGLIAGPAGYQTALLIMTTLLASGLLLVQSKGHKEIG